MLGAFLLFAMLICWRAVFTNAKILAGTAHLLFWQLYTLPEHK